MPVSKQSTLRATVFKESQAAAATAAFGIAYARCSGHGGKPPALGARAQLCPGAPPPGVRVCPLRCQQVPGCAAGRNVSLELSTHAIGGLSLPDFILAAKVDAIKVDYSPAWLKEHPEAAGTALAS